MLGAGIEAAVADPDRVGSVLDHIGDVTLVFWTLGSAQGTDQALAALHGPRLERLLEEIVDTPVRGVVYEAAGSVPPSHLERGAAIVGEASRRWRIPVEIVNSDPGEWEAWVKAMLQAAERLTGTTGSASAGAA
jgi:hypothetical protein